MIKKMNQEELLAKFTKELEDEEAFTIRRSFKFEDETQEHFEAKVASRIRYINICIRASELPGIDQLVCRYGEVELAGFHIIRRCVDEIDNIWISRSR
jgi:hypothetical protein